MSNSQGVMGDRNLLGEKNGASEKPIDGPSVLLVGPSIGPSSILHRVLTASSFATHYVPDIEHAMHATFAERPAVVVFCDIEVNDQLADYCREVKLDRTATTLLFYASESLRFDLGALLDQGIDDFIDLSQDDQQISSRFNIPRKLWTVEQQSVAMSERLRQANNNLATASRRFEELFEKLPVACFTLGPGGMVYEWNRESECAFSMPSAMAFMNPITALFGDSSDGFWSTETVQSLFDGEVIADALWTLKLQSGEERHFVASIYPFRDSSDSIMGVICANVDITRRVEAERLAALHLRELEDANKKLETLSATDGLTGLFNRRYFQSSLHNHIERLAESDEPLSLVLLDVDHFKKYNDSYGHIAGDQVLKTVAEILQRSVRAPDFVARYGGEEFVLVLPGSNTDGAIAIAEDIRSSIERHEWPDRQVTASFGIATSHTTVEPRDFIEEADQALYASKSAGRNCVHHFHQIERAA